MAWIVGKSYLGWDGIDDDLHGTSQGDLIQGLGGDDWIWGEGGADSIYGGDGNDWIWATNSGVTGAWGEDYVDGGNGDDTIDFSLNTDNVELWGGMGNDGIVGGSGHDKLFGDDGIHAGADHDTIYGMGGNDYIYGGEDNDSLYGGDGNDYLKGGFDQYKITNDLLDGGAGNDVIEPGSGVDMLTGGSGHDTFVLWANDGDEDPHHITDFKATANRWIGAYDRISMPDGPDGTASNYVETMIAYNIGYNVAESFGAMYIDGGARYVFITDSVNGYFFSDADGDGTMDSRVVLEGLDSLSDFGYKNVINEYDSLF